MYVRNLTGSPPYGGGKGNRVLSYNCLKNPEMVYGRKKRDYSHRKHNPNVKSD